MTMNTWQDAEYQPLFAQALGAHWKTLPEKVKDLHNVADVRHWAGEATVTRGTHVLSRMANVAARFPPANENCQVEIEMRRTSSGEIWTRRFGDWSFQSRLMLGKETAAPILECFGPMRFGLRLKFVDGRLRFPVATGYFLGLPLPKWLLPESQSYEYVNSNEKVCFDISVSLPVVGFLVRYHGWLEPKHP